MLEFAIALWAVLLAIRFWLWLRFRQTGLGRRVGIGTLQLLTVAVVLAAYHWTAIRAELLVFGGVGLIFLLSGIPLERVSRKA